MQSYLWQFLALTFAGWVSRSQQDAIEYLKEENRVLREQLGERRIRFTNDQSRRLAAKAKALGREGLNEISDLVTVVSKNTNETKTLVNRGISDRRVSALIGNAR